MSEPEEAGADLLRGVVANPRAGTAVLRRLLVPAGRPAWRGFGLRPLPADFVDLALDSAQRGVRSAVAGNPWLADAHYLRLARDPVDLVALRTVAGRSAGLRPRPLPDEVFELVLLGTFPRETELLTRDEIRSEVHTLGVLRNAFRRRMADHPEPELRRQACPYIGALPPALRAALLADPDPGVRAEAERAVGPQHLTPEKWEQQIASERSRSSCYQAGALPPEVLADALARRESLPALARNPHLPPEAVRTLAADPDPDVRSAAARHPALTPESRGGAPGRPPPPRAAPPAARPPPPPPPRGRPPPRGAAAGRPPPPRLTPRLGGHPGAPPPPGGGATGWPGTPPSPPT
ncbi:hypothetical protein ACFV6F_21025 [Kitasatospora phosalacinea]|uniref:hypothetical protein n=1 Tax=Kitasatospora phosalacinea TaxID=2065 RepID=UPI00365E8A1A